MLCGAGAIVRVAYLEGQEKRFIRGKVLEDTPEYLKIELNNYFLTIFREHIIKVEEEKPGRHYDR